MQLYSLINTDCAVNELFLYVNSGKRVTSHHLLSPYQTAVSIKKILSKNMYDI